MMTLHPELKDDLLELLSNAEQYHKWATGDGIDNISAIIIERVTSQQITNDLILLQVVFQNQNSLNETSLLAMACDLTARAQDTTANYKADIGRMVNELKIDLMPNVGRLNENLIDLRRQLLAEPADLEKYYKEEMLEINKELQAVDQHIEMNLHHRLDDFKEGVTQLAMNVDETFIKLTDQLKEHLQLSENNALDVSPPA